MKTRDRILSLIIASLFTGVAVIAVVVFLHKSKTDPLTAARANAKMPVSLVAAESKTINYVIGASGQLQEAERVTLTARIPQTVTSVNVNVGDKITKGQVLMEFQQKTIKALAEEAKAYLNKENSELDYSRLTYQRLLNLYERNLIAKAELETADRKVKESQWEHSMALRKLEEAMQSLDYTTVKSPVTGIVLEKKINYGETPKVNDPVFTLGVIDHVFMKAAVAEERLSSIHLNQKADIFLDSFRNEIFEGDIVKIDPNVNPATRTFIAYIRILNNDFKLVPGLTGFARIKDYKTSVTVPSISIVNPVGDNATVFVVDTDSVAHIKQVKTGVSAEGITEIVNGLKEGENVATAGLQFLKEGDKVNPVHRTAINVMRDDHEDI